jgi:hypothetical protein
LHQQQLELGPLQQQQGQQQHMGSPTAAAAGVRISLPDSPESTGGSLAHSTNDSNGSYPSTGQPLTPNQRVGLQRYLMRQHQLIQTSGMRVRSASGPLPAPVPAAGVVGVRGAQDGGGPLPPGSSSDTTALSDATDASGRSPTRRPQELSRCRTYIVQGEGSVGCGLYSNPSDPPNFACCACSWWPSHPAATLGETNTQNKKHTLPLPQPLTQPPTLPLCLTCFCRVL